MHFVAAGVIMNDKLKAWLQVLGNFGLIMGLLLVGVQINQNSNIARAQMANDAWLQGAQITSQRLGENPAIVLSKIFVTGEQLTDAELFAADAYFRTLELEINRIEHINNFGIEIYTKEQAAELYSPDFVEGFGKVWWEDNRNSIFNSAPNIGSQIQELLESESVMPTQSNFTRIKMMMELQD